MTTAFDHRVILASAGTGKTFALTTRFLALIGAGEAPERILATTFTRKAAGEILRKIAARLADGASAAHAAKKLAAETEIPGLRQADCLRLLSALARSLDRLAIGTIDSLFAKLAAGNALSIGGRDWRMIDEDEDADLRAEAVSRVLHEGDRAELMELVRRRNPGMAGRSVHADILAAVDEAYQTFLASEREAWDAFRVTPALGESRVAAAIAALASMPVPTTKKGAENSHWRNAKASALDAARAGDWEEFIGTSLVARVIAREGQFSKVVIAAGVAGLFEPLIAHAGSVLLADLSAQTTATWGMLSSFDSAYRKLKESRGTCTFDDIPRLLLEHAADDPLREMYYRLDARLHHVLLDEFQDTSVVQWRLLEPLVDEIVSQEQDRSFLCVGDVKQSLYSWRHAEPELLASIPRRWPQVERMDLLASYRSSQVVIDAVNEVMGSIDANEALRGARSSAGLLQATSRWKSMFRPHTTTKDLPGFCRLTVSPGETKTASACENALRAAAARIKELHDAAPTLSIGVLFRSRTPIASMKHELARLKIHASEEGGNPLADSPAVAAVLSMLLLADHPGNSAALFHVATSPLGPLVGLRFPGSASIVSGVAARVRRRVLAEGFAGVIEDWLRRLAPACSERDARRLDQLVSLAVRFDERAEHDPATRASAFVEFVRRRRVEDPSAAPVRLMTVHASKGLEFESVVLPWIEDRIAFGTPEVLEDRPDDNPLAAPTMVTLCPSKGLIGLNPDLCRMYERWRGREALEELCVLYVALTRAIHSLEIFVAPTNNDLPNDDGSTLTFAKIIRGALNPGAAAAGDVLWTHGDAGWIHKLEPNPSRGARVLGDDAVPTIRLDLADSARSRHVPRRSPSTRFEPASPGGWPALEESTHSAARDRGVLFHAWLESIEWLDDTRLDDETLAAIAARLALPAPTDIRALSAEFRDTLKRPNLRAILSRASYPGSSVEVRREIAFAATETVGAGPTALLVGRLDRLVIVRNARAEVELAEVIDFKTDQLADSSRAAIEEHAAAYRGQMLDYRRTAARLLGCPGNAVRSRLVFTTHDALVEWSGVQK